MKRIVPELSIENCKEAIEFYKTVFGGDVRRMQFADGVESFKGHEGKIIHAELQLSDDIVIYLNDVFGETLSEGHVRLVMEFGDKAEIERVYAALAKAGEVHFELQKTFWGSYHGVVTDKYGVTWGLDCPA